jgi:hypothetical protein
MKQPLFKTKDAFVELCVTKRYRKTQKLASQVTFQPKNLVKLLLKKSKINPRIFRDICLIIKSIAYESKRLL